MSTLCSAAFMADHHSPGITLSGTEHKILIADANIAAEGYELLESATLLTVPERATDSQILDMVRDVDAILARTFVVSTELIQHAAALKVVSRHGVGVDNVDVAECTRRGIAVAVTGDANSQAVAEHAIACILAVANRVAGADAHVRDGQWERNRWVGVELYRKVMGVIGLGPIGSRTARIAQGFEMEVLACDPYTTAERAQAVGATLVDLPALLQRADFISIHVPLTAETRHLIGREQLAAMKPGSILVNTARGGLVDEHALGEALVSGPLAGAALDVFKQEPIPPDHPLLSLENLLVSPHIAGQSAESMVRMAIGAADNILRVLRGEEPSHLANPKVLENRSRVAWTRSAT